MIKKILLLCLMTLSLSLYSQNTPNYPQPKVDFKRVDFILPKVENPEDYKVEITFSMVSEVVECANSNFSFNKNQIEKAYGISNSRFPYYIFDIKGVEIVQGYNGDCNKDKTKVKKKIYSYYRSLEDYHYAFPIPYFIPKDWNLEYRIFKAEKKYQTIK